MKYSYECAVIDCSKLSSYKGGLCERHGKELAARSKKEMWARIKRGEPVLDELLADVRAFHGPESP